MHPCCLSNPSLWYLYSTPSKTDLNSTSLWGSLKVCPHQKPGWKQNLLSVFSLCLRWYSHAFFCLMFENFYYLRLSRCTVIDYKSANLILIASLWVIFQRTSSLCLSHVRMGYKETLQVVASMEMNLKPRRGHSQKKLSQIYWIKTALKNMLSLDFQLCENINAFIVKLN